RASFGTTDSEGRYELIYTPEQPGAAVGHHSVQVTTADPQSPAGSEELPAVYNTQTTLSANVKPGENPIDFALNSQP
ncbi:MAG: hypothetical protein KDA79_08650, partial [Planctomycetaceae bacterium]|nr:hypothetical protein [Planctomycetaceae bacterium]